MFAGVLTWLGFLFMVESVTDGFEGFEETTAILSYVLYALASIASLWVLFTCDVAVRIPIALWFVFLPLSLVPFAQVKQPIVPLLWTLILFVILIGSVIYRLKKIALSQ